MPEKLPDTGELFYRDKDGKKQDAALHEEILDNPHADLVCRQISVHVLVRNGWSEAEARRRMGFD